MKCNQSCLGFELVSLCPFPTMITVTPLSVYICVYIYPVTLLLAGCNTRLWPFLQVALVPTSQRMKSWVYCPVLKYPWRKCRQKLNNFCTLSQEALNIKSTLCHILEPNKHIYVFSQGRRDRFIFIYFLEVRDGFMPFPKAWLQSTNSFLQGLNLVCWVHFHCSNIDTG